MRDSGDALFASTGDGWFRRERNGGSFERVEERTAAEPGTVFQAADDPSKAEIVTRNYEVVPVELPVSGIWSGALVRGSTSPDGRYRALDVDVSGPYEPLPFTDIVHGRVEYRPRPHRLGIIDLQSAVVSVAVGVYDNFAYTPVWSDDSQWVIFQAPFQRNRLWACNLTEQRLESISFGRRSPAAPLVNVTDLVTD